MEQVTGHMIIEPGPGDNFGPHTPLIAIADAEPEAVWHEGEPYPELVQSEFGVQVDSFGEPNGLRSDGVKVGRSETEYAEGDDSPMCVCCGGFASRWETNK
jgi:hypothetical protein